MNATTRWLATRRSGTLWLLFNGAVALLILSLLAIYGVSHMRSWGMVDWQQLLEICLVSVVLCGPWPTICFLVLLPKPPANRTIAPRLLVFLGSLLVSSTVAIGVLSLISAIVDKLDLGAIPIVVMLFTAPASLLLALVYRPRPNETAPSYVARFARGSTLICLVSAASTLLADAIATNTAAFDLDGFLVYCSTGAALAWLVAAYAHAIDLQLVHDWQDRCAACGYDLIDLTDCPECGRADARYQPPVGYLRDALRDGSNMPQATEAVATRSSNAS